MSLVYEHIRLDTNEVFYIGIGQNKNRAFTKYNRSNYWTNIVNKHGYKVNIIVNNCSRKEAIKLEKYFIKKYGRKIDGGTLVNITLGGEGICGMKRSEDFKKKVSKSTKESWKKSKDKYNSIVKANGKKVINILTKVIYNSCKEASENCNMKYSTLRAQLNGNNPNKTNFKYLDYDN